MKTLVIGTPESLPAELASNPDVIMLDPQQLGDDVINALDAASGGMLLEGEPGEGGEGPLSDWASEEEAEHGMGRGGYGDKDDPDKARGGEGDEDDPDKARGEGDEDDPDKERGAKERGATGRSGRGGRGDDEEPDKDKERGATGRGGRGGRGLPPLAAWARAMAGGRGR